MEQLKLFKIKRQFTKNDCCATCKFYNGAKEMIAQRYDCTLKSEEGYTMFYDCLLIPKDTHHEKRGRYENYYNYWEPEDN